MRLLGVDLGGQRIGVAISDPTGVLARPLTVIRRTSRVADCVAFAALVKEYQVAALVMGLPLNMNGTDSQTTTWVRDYSAALANALGLPVYLWDERLTTVEAEAIMREQGKVPDKKRIDAIAAAVILQSYLDAQRV